MCKRHQHRRVKKNLLADGQSILEGEVRRVVHADGSAMGWDYPVWQYQWGREGAGQYGRQRQAILSDNEWGQDHVGISKCVDKRDFTSAHGLPAFLYPHGIKVNEVFVNQRKHRFYITAIECISGSICVFGRACSHLFHANCSEGLQIYPQGIHRKTATAA
ncbi:hypothetical protein EMIT053CA3_60246 [Pseudomonas donghuensis]